MKIGIIVKKRNPETNMQTMISLRRADKHLFLDAKKDGSMMMGCVLFEQGLA